MLGKFHDYAIGSEYLPYLLGRTVKYLNPRYVPRFSLIWTLYLLNLSCYNIFFVSFYLQYLLVIIYYLSLSIFKLFYILRLILILIRLNVFVLLCLLSLRVTITFSLPNILPLFLFILPISSLFPLYHLNLSLPHFHLYKPAAE